MKNAGMKLVETWSAGLSSNISNSALDYIEPLRNFIAIDVKKPGNFTLF